MSADRPLFLILGLTLGCVPAVAATVGLNTARIEQLTGAKGKLDEKEGVFRVSLPRTDLQATVADVRVTPPMGLTCWAAFKRAGSHAMVMGDQVLLENQVNQVMDVALDNGLLVPVVRHADRLTLQQLSAETSRLAQGARSGTLSPAELEGATFSGTALGMFGVDAFTPVINPPNAAILGVGRLRDDVVLIDGAVATVKRLTLSLTWDHRVIDGAPAAEFCRTIVELLADPTRLD